VKNYPKKGEKKMKQVKTLGNAIIFELTEKESREWELSRFAVANRETWRENHIGNGLYMNRELLEFDDVETMREALEIAANLD
jgi:hypothetical protein